MNRKEWEESLKKEYGDRPIDEIIGCKHQSRSARLGAPYVPKFFINRTESEGFWYESPEDIERQLRWGQKKEALMAWIRRQIGRRITPLEWRRIEQYYLESHTYRDIAAESGEAPSTVMRQVRRSIQTLRTAAEEEGGAKALLKLRRTRRRS